MLVMGWLDVSDNTFLKNWIKKIARYMIRMINETISPAERVNRILNAYENNSDVIFLFNHIKVEGVKFSSH